MKRSLLFALATLSTAAVASSAHASTGGSTSTTTATTITTIPYLPPVVTWKCRKYNGAACTSADLANPWYRQIAVLSTGFAEADRALFWTEFDKVYQGMANAGNVWSTQKRAQLLWVGYFVGGGALGTPSAAFAAAVSSHPIRGHALALSNDAVYAQVDAIRASDIPQLRPIGVGVLFNTTEGQITANAAPPSFTGRAFGVAKFTVGQVDQSPYITTHELAHASLNFLDEYVEPGLESLNIRSLDVLTPLALFDGSWGGFINAIGNLFTVYDYSISDILAGNGNVNIALSSATSTVPTPGYPAQSFTYEGGMFFGRGTYHMAGSNLMNDNHVMRAADDAFDYAHSQSQQQVIDTAFGAPAERPNDRLRCAGPKNGWPLALGSTTHVMMYDGDKLNQFHPTQQYLVQVGWYDRVWYTGWAGPFPYPYYVDVWRTAQKWIGRAERTIDLRASSLFGLATLAQDVLCGIGITEVPTGTGTSFQLCQQDLNTTASAFLPTFVFRMPYQDTDVPADQWFTTYWWRFASWNGTMTSGYTGWSSFYRSF